MGEREVVINGRTWIMTDVPAPDYLKVKPSKHKFNLTYKHVAGL